MNINKNMNAKFFLETHIMERVDTKDCIYKSFIVATKTENLLSRLTSKITE